MVRSSIQMKSPPCLMMFLNSRWNKIIPNPFNPSTKISYTIPQRSNVKLRVYNMLAQLAAELVNDSQEAGHYQVVFNGSNLPSGTYFYKLEAGKYVEVKKFLLVK